MLTALRLAISDIPSPAFRSVMLKSFGLTLVLLCGLWLLLEALVGWLIDIKAHPWLDTLVNVVAGLGLFIGLAFLIPAVTSLFVGFFTDAIARVTEEVHYPNDPPGRELSFTEAIRDAVAFTGLAIVVNLVALALLLVPGINAFAFLLGNGYLLGRASFEAAARRYLGANEARAARSAHAGKVFVGGLVIAAVAAVPILNLTTPLFATAFMLHLYKRSVRPALRAA